MRAGLTGRWRPAALVVATALAAAGCSGAGDGAGDRGAAPARTPQPVERLTIAVDQDRGPLNVFVDADPRLLELVYDTLLSPSPYVGEGRPWLAEQIRQVDPRTWEARIRRGVTWQDGRPFTADDVAFTFRYFKTAPPVGSWTHHVNDVPTIQSSEIVDADTVRLTCAFACPDLGPITLSYVPILPRHLFEGVAKPAEYTGLPVGTGPYRLTDYSPTSGYRFTANADYFAGAPLVGELVMPIIPDVNATFTALRTGEVDATIRSVPPELVQQFGRQRGLKVVTTKPLKFTELRMNFLRPPFDVPEFRRAVSRSIDRADLLGTVVLGQGRPADKGYPHPDSPWTNPKLSTPSDAAEARRILDGLGYTDGDGDGVRQRPSGEPLAFTIKANGSEPTHVRAAELVAGHLKAVGIAATVQAVDAAGLKAVAGSRDFDFTVAEIGAHGVGDPTQFIMSHRSGYLWQSPKVPYPEWDALFERWKATTTVPERTAVMFEMQELFNRQPTSVPLYYPDERYAFRPDAFAGWAESPGFGIIHKWSFLPRHVAREVNALSQDFGPRQ
ncbi:MAG: peptide ABC transporter substrate-binding protein [Actinobacteria bacterium]|nr:peptide ABC transporter substrate-binding protein [Actinomycetota bacterium]